MVYTDPVPGLWKTVYFPLGAIVSVDMDERMHLFVSEIRELNLELFSMFSDARLRDDDEGLVISSTGRS